MVEVSYVNLLFGRKKQLSLNKGSKQAVISNTDLE